MDGGGIHPLRVVRADPGPYDVHGGPPGLDWKLTVSTFALIFVAELGDKTQLTTMMLAAQSDSATAVFVGAALALVLSALLGVVFGEAITRVVPAAVIHLAAGLAFIGLGILLVLGKL
jgi:putative Ca2+/H+ antiporter (TMEM165/GDT1 family)